MSTDLQELQNRLWGVADELRANSGLKASEYASPVLGLIFLRYANDRFDSITKQIGSGSDRYTPGPEAYIAQGAIYVPDQARFETLVNLPEGADLGKSINDAMKAIEKTTQVLMEFFRQTIPLSVMMFLLNFSVPCGRYPNRLKGTVWTHIRIFPWKVRYV